MRFVNNGGAILSVAAKQRILEQIPGSVVVDGLGSSEAGPIGNHTADDGTLGATEFTLGPYGCILSEDLDAVIEPGDPALGWLATRGRIPLGYLGDPERTARTFPVVDGQRFAVAGDRGRYRADGTVELLGRDAVTINTGGEKVFAEEVEQAILGHPAVADVIVCGRPSERWGSEVVAVVALRPGADADPDELRATAGRSLARYKLPKQIVFRPQVRRSPAGKADYAWARAQTDPDTFDDPIASRDAALTRRPDPGERRAPCHQREVVRGPGTRSGHRPRRHQDRHRSRQHVLQLPHHEPPAVAPRRRVRRRDRVRRAARELDAHACPCSWA